MKLTELSIGLNSLAIFRALLQDPVVSALGDYLSSLEGGSTAEEVSKYASFVSCLYGSGKRTLAGDLESIVLHTDRLEISCGSQTDIDMKIAVINEVMKKDSTLSGVMHVEDLSKQIYVESKI